MKWIYNSVVLIVFVLNVIYANGQSVPKEWQKHGVRNHYDILSKNFARVYNENKSGVINIKGDTIIEAKYLSIFYDTLGYFIVSKDENMVGVINKNKQVVLPCKYEEAKIIDNGIQVILDAVIIYYDLTGKESQHPIYSKYRVQKRNKTAIVASVDGENWGVLNDNEKWLIPPQYSYYFDIRNPNFIIYRDGSSYFIANVEGRVIDSNNYERVDPFGEFYFAKERESDHYSLYEKNGQKWKDSLVTNKIEIKGDLCMVYVDGKTLVFDQKMNLKLSTTQGSFVGNNQKYIYSGEHQYKALYININKVTDNKYRDFQIIGDTIVAVGSHGVDILNKDGIFVKSYSSRTAVIFEDCQAFMASGGHTVDSIYFVKQNRYITTEPFTYIKSEDPLHFITSNSAKSSLYDNIGNVIVSNADRVDMANRTHHYYTYSVNKLVGIVTPNAIIKPIYDEINSIDGELFFVSKLSEWKILKQDGSQYNDKTYSKVNQISQATLLKSGKTYTYLDNKSKKIIDNGEIIDFLQEFPNNLIALKIRNIGWKFYDSKVDTFLHFRFDSISYKSPILSTNLGNYLYNHYTYTFNKLPSNFVSNPDNHMITLNNGVYDVEIYNYAKKKNRTYVRHFKCDSLIVSYNYITTYTKGLISVYSKTKDRYIYKDANSVKMNHSYLLVSNKDSCYVYSFDKAGELISKFKGEKPSFLQGNNLISFSINGVKYIFEPSTKKIIKSKYDFYRDFKNNFYTVENNLKFGIIDANHTEIIPPIYDNIKLFYIKNYFEAYIGTQSCLLDLNGNICIPLDTYYASYFTHSRGLIFAKKDDHYGIYNTKEDKWYPASKYQDIKDCNVRIDGVGNIFIFRENGLYGLMDEKCITLVSPEYEEIKENFNLLELHNNRQIRFFDPATKTITQNHFTRIEYLKDYIIGVRNDTISVYTMNLKFKCRYTGDYNKSYYHKNQFSFTSIGSGYKGIYNAEKCKVDLQPKYQNITDLANGNFVVQEEHSGISIITSSGKILFEGRSSNDSNLFDENPLSTKDSLARKFNELIERYSPVGSNYLKVSNGNKFGIIDANGIKKIPMIYDDFEFLDEYNAYNFNFKRGSMIDIYSRNFELISSVNYDYVGQFRNGLAPVRKGIKWGYIDLKGKLIILLEYDYCDEFNGAEKALVIANKTIKIISSTGVISDAKEGDFSYFSTSKAANLIVESGNYNKENYQNLICSSDYGYYSNIDQGCFNRITNKMGVYDYFYNEIIPPIYNALYNAGATRFIYILDSKYGLLDKSGNKVTEPIYDKLGYEYGTLKASKDGHSFLIDMNGKIIE